MIFLVCLPFVLISENDPYIVVYRHHAACAWAQANEVDSSFAQLFIFAERFAGSLSVDIPGQPFTVAWAASWSTTVTLVRSGDRGFCISICGGSQQR